MTSQEVSFHLVQGWQRSSANFESQAAAIARAREILARNGAEELRVAGRDGAIRQADTIAPGNDPVRSPG